MADLLVFSRVDRKDYWMVEKLVKLLVVMTELTLAVWKDNLLVDSMALWLAAL